MNRHCFKKGRGSFGRQSWKRKAGTSIGVSNLSKLLAIRSQVHGPSGMPRDEFLTRCREAFGINGMVFCYHCAMPFNNLQEVQAHNREFKHYMRSCKTCGLITSPNIFVHHECGWSQGTGVRKEPIGLHNGDGLNAEDNGALLPTPAEEDAEPKSPLNPLANQLLPYEQRSRSPSPVPYQGDWQQNPERVLSRQSQRSGRSNNSFELGPGGFNNRVWRRVGPLGKSNHPQRGHGRWSFRSHSRSPIRSPVARGHGGLPSSSIHLRIGLRYRRPSGESGRSVSPAAYERPFSSVRRWGRSRSPRQRSSSPPDYFRRAMRSASPRPRKTARSSSQRSRKRSRSRTLSRSPMRLPRPSRPSPSPSRQYRNPSPEVGRSSRSPSYRSRKRSPSPRRHQDRPLHSRTDSRSSNYSVKLRSRKSPRSSSSRSRASSSPSSRKEFPTRHVRRSPAYRRSVSPSGATDLNLRTSVSLLEDSSQDGRDSEGKKQSEESKSQRRVYQSFDRSEANISIARSFFQMPPRAGTPEPVVSSTVAGDGSGPPLGVSSSVTREAELLDTVAEYLYRIKGTLEPLMMPRTNTEETVDSDAVSTTSENPTAPQSNAVRKTTSLESVTPPSSIPEIRVKTDIFQVVKTEPPISLSEVVTEDDPTGHQGFLLLSSSVDELGDPRRQSLTYKSMAIESRLLDISDQLDVVVPRQVLQLPLPRFARKEISRRLKVEQETVHYDPEDIIIDQEMIVPQQPDKVIGTLVLTRAVTSCLVCRAVLKDVSAIGTNLIAHCPCGLVLQMQNVVKAEVQEA